MVVVAIIGLLAAVAIPAFDRSRDNAYANRLANDFRVFAGAFETHALENGTWAPDGNGNDLPATVEPYLEDTAWFEDPPTGGYWDWEADRFGFKAAIGLSPAQNMPEVFVKLDAILDDGNLATGEFRKASDRYLYILER